MTLIEELRQGRGPSLKKLQICQEGETIYLRTEQRSLGYPFVIELTPEVKTFLINVCGCSDTAGKI